MWGKDTEDKHSTCASRGAERFCSVGIWSFQRTKFKQHLNPLEIIFYVFQVGYSKRESIKITCGSLILHMQTELEIQLSSVLKKYFHFV